MLTTRTKIALARMVQRPIMAARWMAGRGPVTHVRRGGIRWNLDLREGIDFSIYLLGAFDGRTIRAYEKLVQPGATVLDIGANVGAHTIPLARLVGTDGRVFAFEPTDWAFEKLGANLALNPILARRVTPIQAFLAGAREGHPIEPIQSSWPLHGQDVHPTLRGRAMPTEGARSVRLDDFLKEARVARVDFAKIDVDGYECDVLSGGMALLKRDRPLLVMEFSPYVLKERGSSLDELLDLIAEADYVLEYLSTGNALPTDRAKLATLVPEGAGFNMLARPRGTSSVPKG